MKTFCDELFRQMHVLCKNNISSVQDTFVIRVKWYV